MKREQLPKSTHKVEYRFERTPSWVGMKAEIDNGIAPEDALAYTLTEEDKRKYRITSRRTVQRFIQDYLAAKGKKYAKYRVTCRRTAGVDIIVVDSGAPAKKRPPAA